MTEELAAELSDQWKVEVLPTKKAGHAEELAYRAAKKYQNPLIISVSGDGGYNEVINGAWRAQEEGAKPVCAVAPAGNANDHRRTLRRQDLVKSIREQKVTQIDLLQMKVGQNVRVAHSYIGLGLTPVVAVELNRHTLNRFKEMWLVLTTFWKYQPFEILLDGKRKQLGSLVFANIGQMAKVITLSDQADSSDGQFEIIEFPHWSKLALVIAILKSLVGQLPPVARARKISFAIIKPQPIQLDGEVTELSAGDQVEVKSLPRALATIL